MLGRRDWDVLWLRALCYVLNVTGSIIPTLFIQDMVLIIDALGWSEEPISRRLRYSFLSDSAYKQLLQ